MIKLTQLLKEIEISQPGKFIRSPEDLEALKVLTDSFGEGNSDFDLYNPAGEIYRLNDYEEDDSQYLALKKLLKKYNGVYLLKDFDEHFTCPGAPPNVYYTRVTINSSEQFIEVEIPYIDNEGSYLVGWFDSSRKYHPDTNNFDEDGDYIGR